MKRQVRLLKVRVGNRVTFNHYKQRITLLTETQKQGHMPMHVVEGIRITPSWGKIAMLFLMPPCSQNYSQPNPNLWIEHF